MINSVNTVDINWIGVESVGINWSVENTMTDDKFFKKMVDELVDFAEYDPELADGIKWLDKQASKEGLSFYDMVFKVLYHHDVNVRASEWLRSRN